MGRPGDETIIALLRQWSGTDTLVRCLQDTLTEREHQVITLRYENTGDQPTFADCGRVLYITSERVRQIEDSALRKLRHPRVKRYFE